MVRKSGPEPASERDRIAGNDDDRDLRLLLTNQPHGFQAVHSRHEDIEKQQIEISGLENRQPFAAIAGDDDAVAGPFQQKPDGRLHCTIVVHDQDLCQGRLLRFESGIKSTAS